MYGFIAVMQREPSAVMGEVPVERKGCHWWMKLIVAGGARQQLQMRQKEKVCRRDLFNLLIGGNALTCARRSCPCWFHVYYIPGCYWLAYVGGWHVIHLKHGGVVRLALTSLHARNPACSQKLAEPPVCTSVDTIIAALLLCDGLRASLIAW